jgi:hypothetical protein
MRGDTLESSLIYKDQKLELAASLEDLLSSQRATPFVLTWTPNMMPVIKGGLVLSIAHCLSKSWLMTYFC